MRIIESSEDAFKVLCDLEDGSIIIPMWLDAKRHPATNTLCVLYVNDAGEDILLPYDHNEAMYKNFPIPMINGKIYVPDKKEFAYLDMYSTKHSDRVIGISNLAYLAGIEFKTIESFYTPLQKSTITKFHNIKDVNSSVPLYFLASACLEYSKYLMEIIEKTKTLEHDRYFNFVNTTVTDTLFAIESTGLKVDATFTEYFPKSKPIGDTVHSWYNMFTITGRPSNRWDSVNYAALNKSDGSRKPFISRWSDDDKGLLVMMDFESFHLRLIADLMKYELPQGIPVHQFLASCYYPNQEITKEKYDESKQKTFQLLYGSNHSENAPDFIQSVWKYIETLWKSFEAGLLETPEGRIIDNTMIEEPSPSKVFNYVIQAVEMEVSLKLLNKVLNNYEVRTLVNPLLYTYDAILFDYYFDHTKNLDILNSIKNILEDGGKYPVRVYIGKNYHEMKDITKKL